MRPRSGSAGVKAGMTGLDSSEWMVRDDAEAYLGGFSARAEDYTGGRAGVSGP